LQSKKISDDFCFSWGAFPAVWYHGEDINEGQFEPTSAMLALLFGNIPLSFKVILN